MTAVADLTTLDADPTGRLVGVVPPRPDPRFDTCAIEVSQRKRVCGVLAATPTVPLRVADVLRSHPYLELSSRYGFPMSAANGATLARWQPKDGSAGQVWLQRVRQPGETEFVMVTCHFHGDGVRDCPKGWSSLPATRALAGLSFFTKTVFTKPFFSY